VPAVNPAAGKQSSSSQTASAANTGISQQLVNSSTIPPGSDGEITFISGITSSATVAAIAYATWNGDNPATYKAPSITYQTLYGPFNMGKLVDAEGINDNGQIVGYYTLSGGGTHGFLYSSGTYTTLDVQQTGTTYPEGINNSGQIVGQYVDSAGNSHGFLYINGTFTSIDDPNADPATGGTWAKGINDSGEIVGGYYDANGNQHGFLDNNGSYSTFDDPQETPDGAGHTFTGGQDIINTGQIVGYYNSPAPHHGFLLNGSSYATIEPSGATVSVAAGINEAGQIVGFYNDGQNVHGFLYGNGSYSTLDAPGATLTDARDINDEGQVVGFYDTSAPAQYGFLYGPGQSAAYKWGNTALSSSGTPGGTVTYWFGPGWSSTEENACLSTLALWSDEANISFAPATDAQYANFTFVRVTSGQNQTLTPSQVSTGIGSSTDGSPAIPPVLSTTPTKAEIDFNASQYPLTGGTIDETSSASYFALLHEEGHLIGLNHGGPYNFNINSSQQQFSAYDNRLWTVMSYILPNDVSAHYYDSYPAWVKDTSWGQVRPTTPMVLDILAAQRIYGAPTSGPLATGGQTFGFHCNVAGAAEQYFDFTINTDPVITIWDGGTNNTLDLSGFRANSTISLTPGTFTSCNYRVNNIGIAEGTIINNAIGGSGNDTFVAGSASGNSPIAGADSSALTSTTPSYSFDGGAGWNDAVFSVASTAATITRNTNGTTTVSYSGGIDTFTNVEDIKFTDKSMALRTRAHADFLSANTSDILFRDDSSGDTWFEAMSSGAANGWNQIGGSSTNYAAVGVGDFYGTGTSDALFRNNATGDTWFETISNGASAGWNQIGGSDTHYSVAGVADFYGNGTDDILFRNNSTGDTWFESISSGASAGWHQVGGSNTAYAAADVGDFFGNGTDDILFRNNSSGDTWIEQISNGASFAWDQVGG
jgi:probable HAF family extracellular repeat protein